jgi:hypothetical protein
MRNMNQEAHRGAHAWHVSGGIRHAKHAKHGTPIGAVSPVARSHRTGPRRPCNSLPPRGREVRYMEYMECMERIAGPSGGAHRRSGRADRRGSGRVVGRAVQATHMRFFLAGVMSHRVRKSVALGIIRLRRPSRRNRSGPGRSAGRCPAGRSPLPARRRCRLSATGTASWPRSRSS